MSFNEEIETLFSLEIRFDTKDLGTLLRLNRVVRHFGAKNSKIQLMVSKILEKAIQIITGP